MAIPSFTSGQIFTAAEANSLVHPTFSGYASGTQALSASFTIIQINNKNWDDGTNFNTGTYLYTCPVNGRYRCSGMLQNGATSQNIQLAIFQNGSAARYGSITSAAINLIALINCLVNCSSGDTLGLYCSASSTGSIASGGGTGNYFEVELVSPD